MPDAQPAVPIDGVAVTAIGVAVIRVRESGRHDRLYDDPFAPAFIDAAKRGFTPTRWGGLVTLADQFYEGRTAAVRLVDDRFLAAVDAGIRQIVVLGAGLDTRAFRLRLPSDVTVFELDLPELFAFKEPVLRAAGGQPSCRRVVLPVDLREDWISSLTDHGFRSEEPTLWVDEGVLGYLTRDWNRRVVSTLSEHSAPGSRFDVGRFLLEQDGQTYRDLRRLVGGGGGQSTSWGTADEVQQWLDDLGWDSSFDDWNDAVTALGRPEAAADYDGAGTIAAVRR